MRDLIVVSLVVWGSLVALRRPWIGVLVWTWLSIMNPHRYSWGFAYDAPLAALAAAATLVGLLITRDKHSPFTAPAPILLAVLMVWMTLSWLNGLDVADDYVQWSKVMKVDLMILVALALMRSKLQIMTLLWVAAGSLALLGAKGGLFTVLNGGNFRVWGPSGSFIADNNEFACALVITIPLLRFLQLQVQQRWVSTGMTLLMLLCAAAALGSHSRGGLLAISAMALFLWWRSKSKGLGALVIGAVAIGLIAFMPDEWVTRMNSIETYEEDRSAMGRISAWWNAWNLAFHYPLGVGFNAARPELFARFSPYPEFVHAAHSIYFQILGNHGFVGLGLFLAIWISSWRIAGWLRVHGAKIPEAAWTVDLGNYCQVALVGYAVGGAFLSLSYFDLPYNLMAVLVATRAWVETKSWQTETVPVARWWRLLGIGPTLPAEAKP
ncbi:MAG TPA: putative O-glycosylation ligase, exosortase A system-associated [Roseateles sp.]|nr:putative O-glycosylation ligase, exosortase A system-associated [Roseateles sp.]